MRKLSFFFCMGSLVLLMAGCGVNKYSGVLSSFYTADDSFYEDGAGGYYNDAYFNRELGRLRLERKIRKNETKRDYEKRLEENQRLQNELLKQQADYHRRSQQKKIRQEQESWQRKQEKFLAEERRRQNDFLRQQEVVRQRLAHERMRNQLQQQQLQADYHRRSQQKKIRQEQESWQRKQEKFLAEERRRQNDFLRQQEVVRQRLAHERMRSQLQQQQLQEENNRKLKELQAQRDFAEQKHVEDLYRRQEAGRKERIDKGLYKPSQDPIKEQIRKDRELAEALQKEELEKYNKG